MAQQRAAVLRNRSPLAGSVTASSSPISSAAPPATPAAWHRLALRTRSPPGVIPTNAVLTIYDLRGRHVITLWNGPLGSGQRSFAWRGTDDAGRAVASGVYLAVLKGSEGQKVSTKLALVK